MNWIEGTEVCFICSSPSKFLSKEKGFSICGSCKSLIKDSVILYCISCNNLASMGSTPEILEKVLKLRDEGYEVIEIFDCFFIIYDSCPKCK
jgi:hypothetical protein